MSEVLPATMTAEAPEANAWSGSDQFGSGAAPAGRPKAAALASGGFVLVYTVGHAVPPVGDGWVLRAQIHSADGAAVGPEIQIPSPNDNNIHYYAVAGLPGGGFVVAYGETVYREAEGSGEDLFIQMFDSQGAAVGTPVLVNTLTYGDQYSPQIAMLEDGRFVVTWDDLYGSAGGYSNDIKGQIFTADGQKAGGDFLVTLPGAPREWQNDVAGLPGGGFIVAWQQFVGDDIAIRAQRLDSSGNRIGGVVDVFTPPSGTFTWAQDPEVALLADGGWVVTWTNVRATHSESSVYSLVGQLFAADGAKMGAVFTISPESSSLAQLARIVALGDGGFATVWQELYRDGSGTAIMARFFDSSAVPEGDAFVVNLLTEDYQNDPDVVALGDGGFVVAWSDYGGATPGNSSTVQARIFVPGGFDARDDSLVEEEHSPGQGNVFADNGSGPDSAPSGWTLEVVAVNGSAAAVGQVTALPSGALLTLNSDGSYVYDPNGAFDELAATFTGGSNIFGYDSFTYRLAGGAEATATVTIQGRWSEPHIVLGTDGADTLHGTSLADILQGGGGDDTLPGGEGDDVLDGGAGIDSMAGGIGNDVYVVNEAGDTLVEDPGQGTDEIRTTLASYSLLALPNIENLTAISDSSHDFRGHAGNNVITGGGGADVLRLYDGGDDTVLAGAGNDILFFIGTLNSADVVDGGEGNDTLVIQGHYAGGLTLSASVTQIENVSILGGNNTNFGEPGTRRYDYVLTVNDANFAPGVQARINGAALLAGEDFTFDGSAETDAKFVVYGGKGRDTLLGGLGHDIFFYAEERFASGDTVNGGAGYDGMFLRGNYTIDFNAPGYTGLFTSIENLTLTSATDERYARGGGTEFDYNIKLANLLVGAGETLTISGALLMASETMVLDGSLESDGLLRLFGGKAADTLKGGGQADILHGNLGADQLTGNGGADTFRYDSAAESTATSRDQILDFTPGTDKIDLSRIDASTLAAGNQAFSWIGSNAFDGTAGQLRAFQSGGTWIVEGDTNGDGIADLVIALTLQGPTPLGAGDFIL